MWKLNRSPYPETGFVAVGTDKVAFSVTRSRQRKRTIAFKMEADNSLRVIAPTSASLGALTRLLQKRAAWIERELTRREAAAPVCNFTDGSMFSYMGYPCIVRVTQGGDAPRSCHLLPHRLHVHVPDAALSPENLCHEVRLEITLWIKKRARVKLKQRLDWWARKMGVAYKKLIVTDPQRRWGSCSVDNIIRLNWRLMLAPLPIIDYVVAHELAHVRHKNHAPRFWDFLEQVMPDWRARRKTLRRLERGIMI